MSRRKQSGLTAVEFAVTGAVFMMILFGCLEISRLLYTWNTLSEATRAGARLATVCNIDDEAVLSAAILNQPGGGDDSGILSGLSTENIDVDYLTESGSTGGDVDTARYVRVSITGYELTLLIPFVDLTVTAPTFSTTLPRESLGFVPNPDPTLPGSYPDSCIL